MFCWLNEHCNLNVQSGSSIVDSMKDTNRCNTALLIKQDGIRPAEPSLHLAQV